jgi:hypothetical protein
MSILGYIKRLLLLFVLCFLVFVTYGVSYWLDEGEGLLVIHSESRLPKYSIVRKGLVVVPETLFLKRFTVFRRNLKSIHTTLLYKKDLSEGFLYDLPASTKDLSVKLYIRYSIHPSFIEKVLGFFPYNLKNVDSLLLDVFDGVLNPSLYMVYTDPSNIATLGSKLNASVPQIIERFKQEASYSGILVEDIKLVHLSVPPTAFFTSFMQAKDEISKKYYERKIAEHRGALFAIEQSKKDEAFFSRMERLAVFLEKHPNMKNQILWDKAGSSSNTFVVPLDFELFPKQQSSTIKNKIGPKVVE